MDEYLGLPGDHPSSFRHYLRERVESKVACREFHYLNGDASEPAQECDRYAALLQAQPIDVCVLGVGDNGHLAFNDPPVASFDDPFPVKIVKLDEVCRQQQVNQGHFSSIDAMPAYALTLSIPTLCSARRLLCLVPGKHKAGIIQTMLTGPISTDCPASILRRMPQATLLLEEASAHLI
jgi:glucosamine-6-phosphate deaminase